MSLTHAMEEGRFWLRSYRGRYAEIALLTGVSLSFCRKFSGGEKNLPDREPCCAGRRARTLRRGRARTTTIPAHQFQNASRVKRRTRD